MKMILQHLLRTRKKTPDDFDFDADLTFIFDGACADHTKPDAGAWIGYYRFANITSNESETLAILGASLSPM